MRRGAIDDQKRSRQPPTEGDEAAEPLPEELLRLCDKLRDEVLPSPGVRLALALTLTLTLTLTRCYPHSA